MDFAELSFNHDQGIQTDLVSMNFAKAFDMVPHKRLFYELNWYGIRGDVHYWLADFLSRRLQRVVLDGTPSPYIPVSSGVPQGTVLGPILFLAYINDLSEVVKHSTLRLFADDCIIYRLIKSTYDAEKLQKDIDSVLSWANVWQMKFNILKCCYMHISQATKYKIRTQYTLCNTPLTSCFQCKYLGVIIQSDLKWNHHVEEKVTKANQMLAMI